MSEWLADLSIDQVQPRARFAPDSFVFGFRHVLIVVQPVLNVQIGV
jgi:hypothetical protein